MPTSPRPLASCSWNFLATAALALSSLTVACSEDPVVGTPDASVSDARPLDAAGPRPDAAGPDAGDADATAPADGGDGGDGGLAPGSGIIVRATESSSAGWALGTLRRLSAGELASATLSRDDVVWTDGVPGALPDVGALLVSAATIPDALYAEGARRRVPVVQWPAEDARLSAWLGREVVVRTYGVFWAQGSSPHAQQAEVHIADITGHLMAEDRALIVAARATPAVASPRAVIIPRPVELCAVGQEAVSAFALHYTQPRLRVTPRRMFYRPDVHEPVIEHLSVRYRDGARTTTQAGAFTELPSARYTEDGDQRTYTWTASATPHQWQLDLAGFQLSGALEPGQLPLVLLDEVSLGLSITHPRNLDDPSRESPSERQSLELRPCDTVGHGSTALREITLPGRGVARYTLDMGGMVASEYFTTPITRVRRLELTGVLPSALVVQGPAALTGSVEHHNFREHLVIEPGLDPSLPESARQALDAADITLIYLPVDLALSQPNTVERVQLRGRDGRWRDL
jgi:hypothetical protein